jgi:Ca-activated chloride channel homolog
MKLICQFRASSHHLVTLFIGGVLILAGSTGKAQSFSSATLSSGTNEEHAISVTSELVVLPVNVTDTNGNFVSGLTENNFRVYEEKRLQDLALFQREDAPVSVGLIVDHSGSMELKLPNVITAISAFAHSGNPEDEMFVVDFNDKVVIEQPDGKPFTNNSVELGKAVEAVSAHGRTALYDAVAEGLNHLQLSHLQRKALIVISDGGDNASHCKRSEILELARQSQVMIYSIVLEDEFTKEQDPKVLRQLSEETGGVAFFPESQGSVVDSSAQIAMDLREQYVLGFVPEKHASGNLFHKVQVKVTTPERGKLHVRTRAGYSVASERAALAEVEKNTAMTSFFGETIRTDLR